MDDQSTYAKKYAARLEQWRAEIDKLQAKAKESSADAQMQYQKEIDELRAKQEKAEAKLNELNEAQGKAWEDVKSGFETAWDDLSEAAKNAMGRFS